MLLLGLGPLQSPHGRPVYPGLLVTIVIIMIIIIIKR